MVPQYGSMDGSLITVFISRHHILLFSDGRATNSNTGKVNNEWTKVHRISNYVGMLCAGKYLPFLKSEIIEEGKKDDAVFVEDYAKIAKRVIDRQWVIIRKEIKNEEIMNSIRVFFFIAGYDRNNNPRLFYFDSNKMFKTEERKLFQTATDIEIGAMAHGSGGFDDVSNIIKNNFNHFSSVVAKGTDYRKLLYLSFEKTKDQLSRTTHSIGGKTFSAQIDSIEGFQHTEPNK